MSFSRIKRVFRFRVYMRVYRYLYRRERFLELGFYDLSVVSSMVLGDVGSIFIALWE